MRTPTTLKTCLKCKAEKPFSGFAQRKYTTLGGQSVYYDNTCSACRGKQQRASLRLRLIRKFGGKCACCHEAHPYLLTLDHVEGSEGDHKNNQKARGQRFKRTHQIWLDAINEGPSTGKYQLLCFNCNSAKGLFGVCPHQLGLTISEAYSQLENLAKGVGYQYVNWNKDTWFKPVGCE